MTPGSLSIVALLLVAAGALPGARAEVLDAGAAGFTLRNSVEIAAPRGDVYAAFVDDIDSWWNPDHTVSGSAAGLYLDARPMGCFCESLGAGAGIVHMMVTFVDPAALLRLTGGLGPLGLMGVAGNMTIEFSDSGTGTAVVLEYAVGGYRPEGLDAVAPAVDRVLGEQLDRLSRFVSAGDADPAPELQ